MMAIYFRGMNEQETLNLTLAMADKRREADLRQSMGLKLTSILQEVLGTRYRWHLFRL